MHASQSPPRKERVVRISEIFYSIEGEGPMSGVPTVFVRTFGCNFTCSGFGNPSENKVIPIKIAKLDDFVPTVGCDSIYAWHPAYKDLTKNYSIDQLADQIINSLPTKSIVNPHSNTTPILSLTGGEPTLHQRALIELLHNPKMKDFSKLLIETNAAVNLSEDFIVGLNAWMEAEPGRFILWSNSPKLKISGEMADDAIRPDIIAAQTRVHGAAQYFKFVSDGTKESFEEIADTMRVYRDVAPDDIDYREGVYVMPVGATVEEQDAIQTKVAEQCMIYGYAFCARVHCMVFKNAVGT